MWGLNPFFLGLFFTVLHLVFILFGVSDDRTVCGHGSQLCFFCM